jgi:predicted metal-dependent peptidase
MDDLDYDFLTRELDKTKSDLFMTQYASFYGSLLCSMNFAWSRDIPTACTDGVSIWWNPDFFLKLSRAGRKTVLRHELDHPARLHFNRRGARDPRLWNQACDFRINNDLDDERDRQGRPNYVFTDEPLKGCCLDHVAYAPGMAEEDIYDALLVQNPQALPQPSPGWGDPGDEGDMDYEGLGQPLSKEDRAKAISNVIRAAQQAKLSGAGNMPGDVEKILDKFLEPKIAWENELYQFCTELKDSDYTWLKRNRRFPSIYMPSWIDDVGSLSNLFYFEDSSGSISDEDMIQFNSELKYIHETLRPEKLTRIQFDTKIQHVQEFTLDDQFEHVLRKGYGGTGWACVKAYLEEHAPSAAIIFSDMDFGDTVTPLELNIPVLWVAIHTNKVMPFGRTIFIR